MDAPQSKPRPPKKKEADKAPVPEAERRRRAKQSAKDKAAVRKGTAQHQVRQMRTDPVNKMNSAVIKTVGALIDPDNYPPFRLPDGGRPTFTASLRDVEAIADNQADTQFLTASSGFAVARRDPRCALIVSKGGQVPSTYELISTNGSNAFPACVAGTQVDFSIARYSVGSPRHGAFLMPWLFNDNQKRIWIQSPNGSAAQITMSGLAASTSYTLRLNWLLGKQQISESVAATSSAGGVWTGVCAAPRAGYVSIYAASALPANYTIAFTDNSATGICHLAAPNFWETLNDIDALRINSLSLMCSDRTNALTTQGDICAYQASGGVNWDETLRLVPNTAGNNDPYTAIVSNTKLCHKGEYKKGRYLPYKPTADPREVEYLDIGDSTNPWDIPAVEFSQQTNYLIIGYNSNLVGASTKLIGEWTMCMHVEGESESQWRDSRAPTMHPDVLKEAKHAIAPIVFDFENPSHLAKIWSAIRNVGRIILPYASAATAALPPQYQAGAQAGLTLARMAFN